MVNDNQKFTFTMRGLHHAGETLAKLFSQLFF